MHLPAIPILPTDGNRTGAYKTLAEMNLPSSSSSDYTPALLYKARALLALGNATEAETLTSHDTASLSVKAVNALARYVAASASGSGEKDAALEELRDMCVEIEGEDMPEAWKSTVRVVAGTAFAREGEIEEALETLGAGGSSENLEA